MEECFCSRSIKILILSSGHQKKLNIALQHWWVVLVSNPSKIVSLMLPKFYLTLSFARSGRGRLRWKLFSRLRQKFDGLTYKTFPQTPFEMFRLKISGWRLRSRLEDFARMEIGLYIGQAQIARRGGLVRAEGVWGGCVQLGAAVLPVKVIHTECCQTIQSFWSSNSSVFINYVPCLAWRKNQWQQSW